MLKNNVLQHIGIDPAGQLAQLKTRHRWQRSRIAGRLEPGTQGQREGKRKE